MTHAVYQIAFKPSFIRDLKKFGRRGGDTDRVRKILRLLASDSELPSSLRDHQLSGRLRDFRELHVEHDWLLVYQRDGKRLIIHCIWLVTHKKLKEREQGL